MTPCKTCGLEHRGWVSCAKARADLAEHLSERATSIRQDVAMAIANTVANEPEVANKRGVYKDKEKRKAYMRELMRKRRER